MAFDPEHLRHVTQQVSGFANLADVIASDIDHDAVIFKRFGNLAARNLLYLQSELAELEAKLKRFDKEDDAVVDRNWESRRAVKRSWAAFEKGVEAGESRLQQRMDLVLKIRAKLKEYRETLIAESAILSMRKPSKQAYEAVMKQFRNEQNGKNAPTALDDSSENIYDDRDDLVALRRPETEDRLTVFLRTRCYNLFKVQTDGDAWQGIRHFSAHQISVVVSVINVVLAAAFLFGAIYTLYNVHRDQTKLGLIACFTVTFAVCISLISNARRSEVFGACAAYAAVLVVFISGNLGNNGRSTV